MHEAPSGRAGMVKSAYNQSRGYKRPSGWIRARLPESADERQKVKATLRRGKTPLRRG